MTLSRVLDVVADRLGAFVPGLSSVGPVEPAEAAGLPAVVLSVDDATYALTSVGALPAPSRTGALPVVQDHDLADPVVTFPDGEVVNLLSADRRILHFAHGPVVAADGTDVPVLSGADLVVQVDAADLTVVSTDPVAGEVRADPALGELTFGSALPPTGALHIEFTVGEWEVATQRYQGVLIVEPIAATGAATDVLSRSVEDALAGAVAPDVPQMFSLRPVSFGSIRSGAGPLTLHRQVLTYRFDFEAEDPILGTGGGLIARVAVDSTFGLEEFDVTREGSSP